MGHQQRRWEAHCFEFFVFVGCFRNLFLLSKLLLFLKQCELCALCLTLTLKHSWSCRSVGLLASALLVNRNGEGAVNFLAAFLLPFCPCYCCSLLLKTKQTQSHKPTHAQTPITVQPSCHSTSSKSSFPFMVTECLKYLSLCENLKEPTECGFQTWHSVFNVWLLTKARKGPHSPCQCYWNLQDHHLVVARSLRDVCEAPLCQCHSVADYPEYFLQPVVEDW